MNAFGRLTSLAFLSSSLLFAQQSTPPTTPPATPPASSQDLPDSPGTQAHVSPQPTGPTAVIDTSMGRITCKLFSKEAPQTVANFVALAQGTKDWTDPTTHKKVHGKPLYDGTQFHRVIPEFMIQGGDPTATGMGDPGYMFEDEFDPNLNFDVPGRLAMANSGPNTNGSQFFITEVPTEHLDQKHTIFGQCDDSSVLVVKSIARVERDGNDKPVDPVILTKVTIVPDGKPLPAAPGAATTTSK
jgi:peptidyl-prolyl cis-trans isomerase A (cyclophilin A)